MLAGHSGAEVVRGVEQVLLAERQDARFATIAMVSLNPALTQASVLLRGHPAPLLIRGSDVRELNGRALPILTLLQGRAIEPFTVDLDGDWGLLLFTDGLVEGRAAPGARGPLRRRRARPSDAVTRRGGDLSHRPGSDVAYRSGTM